MAHDLLVIGGGSAGYAAARTAAEAGADVGIVDHGPLGGLCILRGCMPSKTILRSSDLMAQMRRAAEFGLSPVAAKADLGAIIDRKARLVREFAEDRINSLRSPRYTLYEDRAAFVSPHEVAVGNRLLKAKAFVISTGSVPSRLPIPGLEEAGYLTSDDLLELRDRPRSLLVLGGGAVALELGQFFARIGTSVTLVQRSPHLLSHLDEDLVLPVEAQFRDEGVTLHLDTQLHRVAREGDRRVAFFSQKGQEMRAAGQVVLQALGRRPNIDGLSLAAAGVDTRAGRIVVDDAMRTTQPHIFAAGDVTGLHEIVHIAIEQGEMAARNALRTAGPAEQMNDRLKVEVIFTDPQVATLGLSERDCRARDIPYLSASYPFHDHGKSLIQGATRGHVKLICRPESGEVIGAHIVGPEAGELIHELIAVAYYRGTVYDLLRMPHYHPTLAEIVTYPAEELVGRLKNAQT